MPEEIFNDEYVISLQERVLNGVSKFRLVLPNGEQFGSEFNSKQEALDLLNCNKPR